MNRTAVATACGLVTVTALVLLAAACEATKVEAVKLYDCDWTVIATPVSTLAGLK